MKYASTNNFSATRFALLSLALLSLSLLLTQAKAQELQESPLAVQTLPVDELFSLIIRADGDNDPPARITARQLPQDAVLLRNLDGSRTFMWIPQEQDIGETTIRITVTDASDPAISATYPIHFEISADASAAVSNVLQNSTETAGKTATTTPEDVAADDPAAEATESTRESTALTLNEETEATQTTSQIGQTGQVADGQPSLAPADTVENPIEEAIAEVEEETKPEADAVADVVSETTTDSDDISIANIANADTSAEEVVAQDTPSDSAAVVAPETGTELPPTDLPPTDLPPTDLPSTDTQSTTQTNGQTTPLAEAEEETEVTADAINDTAEDLPSSEVTASDAAGEAAVASEPVETAKDILVEDDTVADAAIIANPAPQLSVPSGEILAYVNRELTVSLEHADDSGRSIRVTGLNLPAGAVIEPGPDGHLLRWTPREIDMGATAVIVVANDETNPTSRTVRRLNITIRNNP